MISITKLVCGTAVALISSPRVFAVDEDWGVIQYQVCKPWKLFFLMLALMHSPCSSLLTSPLARSFRATLMSLRSVDWTVCARFARATCRPDDVVIEPNESERTVGRGHPRAK